MGKKYKVLIVDGGGIYGAIPARFLSHVSKQDVDFSMKDLNGVDCISGCSIGGILSAAYASGKSFAFVDQKFQERVGDCFVRTTASKWNPLANHKYKNSSLDSVIDDMIGDATLGGIKNTFPNLNIVIPCLDLTDDYYKVFDNFSGFDYEVKLADIAKYTSAAPTYFGCRNFRGKCIVDGGIIECNPLFTTITALRKKLGIQFEDMDVLMLGVGQDVSPKKMTISKYESLSLLGIATEVITPYVTLSNTMVTKFWGENVGLNKFIFWNPIHTAGELDNVDAVPGLVTECDKYHDQFIEVWNKWLHDVE